MGQSAAFDIYLACVGFLMLNLWFLTAVTVIRRTRSKIFIQPEDAAAFKGQHGDDEGVERARAAHRNALESVVPFAVLGLLYLMAGGTETGAKLYFITFTAARWLHSVFYLMKLQPMRTLVFVIAFLCNIGLTVQILIHALG